MSDESPVMYIFVNDDLNMSKGQIVAQCCHMSSLITDECVTTIYEEHPPGIKTMRYLRWRENCVKVIKRATATQLKDLSLLPYARRFTDEGHRIPADSLTVVGFLPMPAAEVQKDVDLPEYKLL